MNRLQREGCLAAGWAGSWQWSSAGKQTGLIGLSTSAGYIHLSYKVRVSSAEWQDVKEDVRITREPCRYGGTRPYFLCPGIVNGIPCGRRVVKLYAAGRYFLCRHCYRLSYASQNEGSLDRTHRRVRKVRRRLGGTYNLLDRFPDRPKGMWERTYLRLRDTIMDDEMHAERMLVIQGQQLVARQSRHAKRRTTPKKDFWS